MPENLYHWLWWAFFFGGAIGGWGMLIMFVAELLAMRRELKQNDLMDEV